VINYIKVLFWDKYQRFTDSLVPRPHPAFVACSTNWGKVSWEGGKFTDIHWQSLHTSMLN